MTKLDHPAHGVPRSGHAAEVLVRIGERAAFEARITSVGLLSVGALVSGILLSTAVVVLAAGRKRPAPPATAPHD